MIEEKLKTFPDKTTSKTKYCSDYTEDCCEIKYPYLCAMGGIEFHPRGIIATPPADGICKELEKRRKTELRF